VRPEQTAQEDREDDIVKCYLLKGCGIQVVNGGVNVCEGGGGEGGLPFGTLREVQGTMFSSLKTHLRNRQLHQLHPPSVNVPAVVTHTVQDHSPRSAKPAAKQCSVGAFRGRAAQRGPTATVCTTAILSSPT
jgi:hypothetical protein